LAKTIGKKQKAKTKGMAMGHAFFLFLFPLLPISIPPSAFSRSRINSGSIVPGHNHEIPEIHQQDSSYREAQ